MRKLCKESLRNGLWAVMVSLFATSASAQFNPPVSFEDTYPTPGPNIAMTGHTSAYSYRNINTMLGTSDLAISGWDDALGSPCGVAWRLLTPGLPSAIMNQGIIPYMNVQDLEVGYIHVPGDHQIVVAYHQPGLGHMVDVYSLATGTPAFLYTYPLSGMPNYTRISIDCHKTYGLAFVWQDVGGITTTVALNTNPITFSGALTLSGTMGNTVPDCAFSHGGPLNVQYVYYDAASGNMIESAFDFWTAIYLPTGTITPTVNDINPVGSCYGDIIYDDGTMIPGVPVCPYPNIDCPGHYNVENWTYTYTTNNTDISVRLLDLNTSLTAATVVVNDGSALPSIPINMVQNLHPFCVYDHKCGPTGITVGWFTTAMDPMTGAQAGYIGLRMNENGTALFSAPSYLTVANNPTLASPTPVLSMSKEDDMFQFIYIVFPEFDPMMGGFQMGNKYPPFCSNSFRGDTEPETGCNDEANIAAFHAQHLTTAKLLAHPNPFTNTFVLSIPADMMENEIDVAVINMMGMVTGRYKGSASNVNGYLNGLSKNLASGTYLVQVNINGKLKETLKVVKTL